MPGQFDKETSIKNFEWHRERALREKKKSNPERMNRIIYNLNAIESRHGSKAAKEVERELKSKSRDKSKKYFT